MRTQPIRRAVATLIGLALLATVAFAAQPVKKTGRNPATETQMAEMMKRSSASGAGEKLKAMEGKWSAAQKTWPEPGQPLIGEGTCENKLVQGGRFLEQRYKGTLMGRPYEAFGLTGYDHSNAAYTMLWVDSTTTAMVTGQASTDSVSSEITMRGTGEGPGGPTELRMVTRVVDANRHVFSVYGPRGGKEELMMEITYQRSGR
jgi:hypothetical protein